VLLLSLRDRVVLQVLLHLFFEFRECAFIGAYRGDASIENLFILFEFVLNVKGITKAKVNV